MRYHATIISYSQNPNKPTVVTTVVDAESKIEGADIHTAERKVEGFCELNFGYLLTVSPDAQIITDWTAAGVGDIYFVNGDKKILLASVIIKPFQQPTTTEPETDTEDAKALLKGNGAPPV